MVRLTGDESALALSPPRRFRREANDRVGGALPTVAALPGLARTSDYLAWLQRECAAAGVTVEGAQFDMEPSTTVELDGKKAMQIVEKTAAEVGAERVSGDPNIAKVSVVGVGMRNHSGIATTMFHILSRENINIIMISTSEIKISCVIEEKYTELAVRALHDAFELEKENLPSEE